MAEMGQIKEDISELKTNVSFIKTEVHDMKQSITGAIDKISTSMAAMATVTEKLNQNIYEHKNLSERIEYLEEKDEKTTEQVAANTLDIRDMKMLHAACTEQKKIENENKKNSIINRAKDKVVEYAFIVLMSLTVYILVTNFQKFLHFMTSNQNVVLPK